MSNTTLRRILHVASAGVLLLVPVIGWGAFPRVVTVGGVLALAVEGVRLTHGGVRRFFVSRLPVFRPSEATRPCGAAWLAAAFVAAAWFPPPAAMAGILVAALADPAASTVGTRFSRAGEGNDKTWIGSGAFVLVAIALVALLGHPWTVAVIVGSVGTALERWSGPLDDNLLVAPGVATSLLLLG